MFCIVQLVDVKLLELWVVTLIVRDLLQQVLLSEIVCAKQTLPVVIAMFVNLNFGSWMFLIPTDVSVCTINSLIK